MRPSTAAGRGRGAERGAVRQRAGRRRGVPGHAGPPPGPRQPQGAGCGGRPRERRPADASGAGAGKGRAAALPHACPPHPCCLHALPTPAARMPSPPLLPACPPRPCCLHALPAPADPRPFAIRGAAHAVQVRSIVGTLLEVLNTSSESVQRGVSDCLPALMQASLRAVGCNRPRIAPARRLAGGLGRRAARLPLACARTGMRGWSRAGKPGVRPHPRSLARQALQGGGGFVESLRRTACQP